MGDMTPCKHGIYTAYLRCRECEALERARKQLTLTHFGWWMFCPVALGALDTEAPLIVPRWRILSPLFWLAGIAQSAVIGLCSLCFEEYEPRWYFLVTQPIHAEPQSSDHD